MKYSASLIVFFNVVAISMSESPKPANETPLPAAPAGYKWERFTEIQSAFLCPTGWHRFHKEGTNSHTFVLSKESVGSNGVFETGLTVQTAKFLQTKSGVSPAVFSATLAQEILKKKENKEISSKDVSSGPFKAFFIRYRNEPERMAPIIIHQVFISNEKKDTLFIVTFEAPEQSWDEAWRIGETMVKKFLIDDEY